MSTRSVGVALVASVALASLCPVATSVTAASAAPAFPRVLTCAGKTVVRPARYVLACADANTYFDKIHWKSWGATSATGTATYVQNTCTPTCAQGSFVRRPAALTLSKPKKTPYGLLFSVIHYRYLVAVSSTLPLKPLSAVSTPSA